MHCEQYKNWSDLKTFLCKQHFYKQHHRLKLAKTKQYPEALNFCYLKSNHFLYRRFYYIFSVIKRKMIGHILKNVNKNKYFCFSKIDWLIIMEMQTIMKN